MSIKRPRKLSTILIIYFLVSIMLLGGTLLYWTYYSATNLVRAELIKSFDQRHRIAEELVEREGEHLDSAIRELQLNEKLLIKIAQEPVEQAQEVFQGYMDKHARHRLDVMFVSTSNKPLWLNASSPVPDVNPILLQLAAASRGFLGRPKLAVFHSGGICYAGIFKSSKLVLESGEVLGVVVVGTIFNDNLRIMNQIKTKSKLSGLLLICEQGMIASSIGMLPGVIKEISGVVLGSKYLANDKFVRMEKYNLILEQYDISLHGIKGPVSIVSVVNDEVLTGVRQTYLRTLYFISAVCIVLLIITIYMIRRLIYPAMRRVLEYTDKISRGELDASFTSESVLEFNTLGLAMETMVKAINKTQASLFQKEAILSGTLNSTLDGILVVDKDGKILTSNHRFAEMWGIPESLIQAGDDRALIESILNQLEDPNEFIARVEVLYNSSEKGLDEIRFKDGRVFERYGCVLAHAEHKGRVWNFRDISERKRAEEELKVFQSAVAASTDAIGISTADGRHYYQNQAFDNMFGAIGEDAPATVYASEEVGREVFQTIMTGKQWVGEVQMSGVDNKPLDVFLRAYAVEDENGQVTNLIGVHTDITSRKLAEKELQKTRNYLSNIIDSMPSLLVGVDLEGLVTQWNAEAVQQTGITPNKAIGQPLANVIPDIEPELDKITEAIKARRLQVIVKHASDGKVEGRFENVTIYPLVADGVDGAVIRIDDVTEQVRMEQMMVQSEKMLSVGGLAAGMAHEINNPLGGMMQNANIIQNRLTDCEMLANVRAAEEVGITMEQMARFMEARQIPQLIQRIIKSGKRAAEIVQDMLSFARKEDGTVSSQDMSQVVDKCVELSALDYDLKNRYDFKQIKIVKEHDENLPMILCEVGKIQQVIMNILKNGAEIMQEGGLESPCFVLRLINEEEASMIRIEIEDNGPGMPEEVRKRIFEPFFTTKSTGHGIGLGLSVSYFIITETHGGEMWVESKVGKGTKFIIRLPLKK